MEATKSSEIVVNAKNPLDLPDEEVEDLVTTLRTELPATNIRFVRGKEMPPGARGLTWWQILIIRLQSITPEDLAAGWISGKVLDAAYRWAKARFKSKKATGRPQAVFLYDADGKEVGSMVLKSARHKPVTHEEATKPPPVKKKRKRKPPSPVASRKVGRRKRGRPK